MRTYYPVFFTLENRRCVVVGGGQVALGKIKGLLDAGAIVTVIAPEVDPHMEALIAERRLTHLRRAYRTGDLEGAFLVIAATDDMDTNRAVWQEAETRNIPCNVVDQPELCSFIAPAIVRKGPVAVAISTGGASPALAKQIKQRVAHILPDSIGEFAELLGELRPLAKELMPDLEARNKAWERVVTSDAYEVLLTEGIEAARSRVRAILMEEARCTS